ncbi:Cna B-type domain-containing protein [Trueperella sp.]|uniref:Cna B-type domain-containing protein n=1 Tax=Trueperella sp. TaxID=2699835 RepID=UPI0026152EC8|nr:Cna B-type domain-containing protein [Trueperella sp.]
MTEPIVIPAGADIEFMAYGDDGTPMASFDSELAREDGFKGNIVKVDKGAKLTLARDKDGWGVNFRARDKWVNSRTPMISVGGELVMDAGKIEGARELSGFYSGAVQVSGAQASFTMNGGEITDNTRGSREQYGAAGVAVSEGARFTMNGGSITANKAGTDPSNDYGGVGGLGLYKGAKAVINGGTIANNDGWAGGIIAFSWPWSKEEAQKYKDEWRNCLQINGGVIEGNYAGYSGGGVFIFGNSVATMTGGTIAKNMAPNGGGVGTQDDYVVGADGSWREVPGTGKSEGLSALEWAELVPAAFHMTGGTIEANEATRSGGGVNVVSNAVSLVGGTIRGNSAFSRGNYAQGGGVYVATASYTAHFENVLVQKNSSSVVGGGIWVCPTGSIELYVTNGGAVVDNSAKQFGADIAHINYGSSGSVALYLSQRMLGGGEVNYYWDNSKARFDAENPGDPVLMHGVKLSNQGLKTVVAGTDGEAAQSVAHAKNAAKLVIEGNTADLGAGIGSNGRVVIGEKDVTDIEVSKTWVKDGEPATEGLPESIELQVVRVDQVSADDGTVAEAETPVGPKRIVKPDANGDWKATFYDLPKYDVEGSTPGPFECDCKDANPDDQSCQGEVTKAPIVYRVKETPVEGWVSESAYATQDGRTTVAITNSKKPEEPSTPPPTPEEPSTPPTPPTPPAPTTPTTSTPTPPPGDLPKTGSTDLRLLGISAGALLVAGAVTLIRKRYC